MYFFVFVNQDSALVLPHSHEGFDITLSGMCSISQSVTDAMNATAKRSSEFLPLCSQLTPTLGIPNILIT